MTKNVYDAVNWSSMMKDMISIFDVVHTDSFVPYIYLFDNKQKDDDVLRTLPDGSQGYVYDMNYYLLGQRLLEKREPTYVSYKLLLTETDASNKQKECIPILIGLLDVELMKKQNLYNKDEIQEQYDRFCSYHEDDDGTNPVPELLKRLPHDMAYYFTQSQTYTKDFDSIHFPS